MAQFIHKVVNKEGKVIEGSISAITKGLAKKKLEKEGLTVIFLDRKESSFSWRRILSYFIRFSPQDRIAFFRNLGTMLAAGVPIAETLRVIAKQSRSHRAETNIMAIVADIENGKQLSAAMKKFPALFSPFLVETVSVGELSGRLNETLDRISNNLESDFELQREVQSQMAYPAVVIVVMLSVLVLMTTYVLPKIASLFSELQLQLPLPTRILLAGGIFVQNYFLFIAGGIAAFIIFSFFILKSKVIHYALHYFLLRLPIFGEIIKESNLVLLFRSLESLMASGVSFPRAIEVTEKTLTNDVYRKSLEQMRPWLLQGINFSDSLKRFPFLFPAESQSMIEIGGRTGRLEESFVHVTSYYERSLRNRAKTMTSLIEPILMLVVGLVVGFIALSIFMPIYQTAYTKML